MKSYQTRDDVPAHEKWRLEDIYSTTEAWEQDAKSVLKLAEELKAFDGNIHDAQALYNFLKLEEELSFIYRKVYAYAMFKVDSDTRVSASQALMDQARQIGQKAGSATAFFRPYLLSLDESTLKGYIEQLPELTYFEEDLFEVYRYKKHVLSKEQEDVLSQMSTALSAPQSIFGMINNADIKFGDVTNEDDEKVELTRGMYAKILESEDREKRIEAFKAYYQPYLHLKNTIGTTYASAVKNNVAVSRLRHYPSALEKALFADNVPKEVYDHLIKATKDNIAPLHRYMSIRKEQMGLDELHQYDLSVPLVQGAKQTISFEEAFDIMLKGLAPLGEEYISILSTFKDKHYIDVRETPGKRSGAYNMGLYGVHPFILLNHRDDLDSLFTLAHECGHGMHSYFSTTYQPQITASYTIFVAEVASTVNEVLLIRYLLKTTEDKLLKKHLLNHFIDSFKGTFFTQVMFAEFEKLAHEKAEKDEPLNTDVFNAIYEKIYHDYNGPEVVLDDEIKYSWTRIPHFYRPFYVYKYATGYTSAIHIADKILEGDQETLKNYLNFLKSGSSDYPLELLKATGVDLTTPEPIQNALAIFSGLVDEFAALD
ncbi:oligoendopeptidase F [Pullulanibacillus sp. KACC 23026]|uniref:oligoendopeptidase F n=1 Tax=Pullulanibacillus sp. KACC 23026 TaxID=3028315 RepID=UPI0023AFACE8|nr:oligoendopeptidase F [Pullulanibacillus sp. KACC 23026]WEG11302.1 oligoendopeptidase F [Pullulanibacillus sp. KACC 23026]